MCAIQIHYNYIDNHVFTSSTPSIWLTDTAEIAIGNHGLYEVFSLMCIYSNSDYNQLLESSLQTWLQSPVVEKAISWRCWL